MRHWINVVAMVLSGVVLGGCIEKTEKVTLNPDGSGKTEVSVVMQTTGVNLSAAGQPKPDPQFLATRMARAIVQSSVGVEAWKDVSFKAGEDGRTHFSGTAYFSDFNKVDLKNIGRLNATWSKQPDGGMLLEIKQAGKPAGGAAPAALTDEQIAAKVAEAKSQYAQSKPAMTGMLTGMKLDVTYILPGQVEKIGVFKPVAGGVRLQVTGEQILQGMDRIATDDAWMAASLRAERDAMQGATDEEINELILGVRELIQARVKDANKPLFDYAAEVATAKAAQPAMITELGLD